MPIIPLPKITYLEDVPEPVLDRVRRPTFDNSPVIEGLGLLERASRMPEVPARPFAAQYDALSDVGDAVSGVGREVTEYAGDHRRREQREQREERTAQRKAPADTPEPLHPQGAIGRDVLTHGVLGAFEKKREDARTMAQIHSADELMTAHSQEFSQYMAENPDEEQWETIGAARRAQVIAQLQANPNFTPTARNRILERAQLWDQRAGLAVTAQAAKTTFAKAKAGIDSRIQQSIQLGDPHLLRESTAAGLELGVYSPADGLHFENEFQRTGEQQAREAQARSIDGARTQALALARAQGESAGVAFLQGLAVAGMDPELRAKYEGEVRARARTQRLAAARALATGLATGQVGSAAAVAALTSAHLTEPMRAYAARAAETPTRAAEADPTEAALARFARVVPAVRTYEAASDPDAAQYLALHHAIAELAPHDQDAFHALLDERAHGRPQPPAPGADPVQRYAHGLLARQFDPRDGLMPWRRTALVPDESGAGEAPLRAVVMENSTTRQHATEAERTVRESLAAWLGAPRQAPPSAGEVEQKLRELLPAGVRTGALAALQRRADQQRALAAALMVNQVPLAPSPEHARQFPPGTVFRTPEGRLLSA